MNIGDVVSGRAKLKGIRWALLSVTANKVLADQLRALLPVGAAVGPCRLREARFNPGHKITAYYDALVNTESPEGRHVRPIAVTWGPSTRADRYAEHEETLGLAKIQAEAVRHGVAAPFLELMADLPEWDMHIRVSPLDPRVTQLARLTAPSRRRGLAFSRKVAACPCPTTRADARVLPHGARIWPGWRPAVRITCLWHPPAGPNVMLLPPRFGGLYRTAIISPRYFQRWG